MEIKRRHFNVHARVVIGVNRKIVHCPHAQRINAHPADDTQRPINQKRFSVVRSRRPERVPTILVGGGVDILATEKESVLDITERDLTNQVTGEDEVFSLRGINITIQSDFVWRLGLVIGGRVKILIQLVIIAIEGCHFAFHRIRKPVL